MANEVREGSAPNFCPPTEEGITLTFQDEGGEEANLEFLGLVLVDDRSYGAFFPLDDGANPLDSGEVVILEATEFDEDDQPEAFEMVQDEAILAQVYEEFKKATKDLYRFE